MFKKIKKRNGNIVKFNSWKISNALSKAGESTAEFDKIIAENPEYFSGSNGWWKNADDPEKGYGMGLFYKDLVGGKTGPISQQWYKTFDSILSTITL